MTKNNRKDKAKNKKDFPEDFYTQKMIFEQGVEAYFYMKAVSDTRIKRNLEKQFPYDYFTQKIMYEQEVNAKDEMK